MPVTMFKRQNKRPCVVLIEQRRTPFAPRSFNPHAIIAKCVPFTILTGQRRATQIADQPANKRCLSPTRTAEAKITFNQPTAFDAPWRINQVDRGLNLFSHHSIVWHMQNAPQMTDRAALKRNRSRADRDGGLFLHHAAAEEVKDRLTLVNRAFTKVAIVTPFPEAWRGVAPQADIIEDSEVLDLKAAHYDLVLHAMCLHWANDPVGQIIQCRRALKNDGLFMCVSFGGQTLHELRSALAQAEADVSGGLSPRVAPMGEIRDLGALLQRGGLSLPVADALPLKVTYETPWHLMRDLRSMGEANALAGRLRRATSRSVMLAAVETYVQSFMEDGRIPATFELIFLTGWAPDDSQPQPLRPGSATTRLAAALGTQETPLKD